VRAWLTASDIAALRLPGLPTTKRGVLDLAIREDWAGRAGAEGGEMVRQSRRRGGGTEYHADLLPAAARAALVAHQVARVAGSDRHAAAAAAEPEAARLTAPAAEHRDARLAVLNAIDKFRHDGGLSATTADGLFVARYNLGKVAVDDWIRGALPVLAHRSVARWRALVKAGTLHRLAHDPGARRRGKGLLERDDVRTFCLGAMARNPHYSPSHLLGQLKGQFPAMVVPAERTMRLAMATWRERYRVELARLTNPDAFRNKYRTAGTNSHQVSRLNELWMIDASPADVLTKDGRYSVYVCIDIYSRRLMIYVAKTARAEAVGLLMRRAILAWGMPERVKTDNGSDFKAKRTVRLMASLGVEVETSTAFSPWEKGHIERAIRTLQHDCMTILPGFIGHSVADRKVIEERRAFAERLGESDDNVFCVDLTPAELQGHCDGWAAGRYAARPHDGLSGVTPQAAAAGYIGTIRTVDVHALDVLLAPIAGGDGIRTVQKTGVRVGGRHYLTPTVLPDTRVLVRMDPADMGRAWLFAADGEEYLGEAVCPELAGIDPAAFVAATRKAHAEILRQGTAGIKAAMKSLTHRDVADMLLRQGAIDAGVLVEFPRAAVPHTTPALAAAAEAAAAADGADRAIDDQVAPAAPPANDVAEPTPSNVQRLRTVETAQQRYRRARDLETAMAAGAAVEAEEARWLGGYQLGSEYRGMRAAYEDFGEAALR